MRKAKQSFGGDWTQEKLERVRKYLSAYTTIMSHYNFRFAYIDAFAGTGYRTIKKDNEQEELPFPDLESFLDGSARIALQIQPRFTKYIFIEQNESRFAELQKLKEEFPRLQSDIILVNADANSYIRELCLGYSWKTNRAVLFLDPFGMEVTWETIEAVAATKAVDLWLLFPLGVAVNRMLTRNGQIRAIWREKLNRMFGADDWYDVFYQTIRKQTLFGEEMVTQKVSDFDLIGQYFVGRLKTVFAGVANNPLPLFNSHNNPLYLLCFASGNPKGAKTAINIAQDILRR
ncbi:MAG: three-Cys-motif partner protein TcmP [Blastocatellia bacterium]